MCLGQNQLLFSTVHIINHYIKWLELIFREIEKLCELLEKEFDFFFVDLKEQHILQ